MFEIKLMDDQKPYVFEFLVKLDPTLFVQERVQKQVSLIREKVAKINLKLDKSSRNKANSCNRPSTDSTDLGQGSLLGKSVY
jgi:hypothetical protein